MPELFGTPVDGVTIAVRPGEESPLVILLPERGDIVQAYVALRASAPPLSVAEADALRAFYAWDAGESTWWRTQLPARFSLERVGRNLLAGHLVERGAVIPAGDDPAWLPEVGGYFFRALRRPPEGVVGDPCGPVFLRRGGSRECVFEAPAIQAFRAVFPCFGPEVAWLRMFREGRDRPALLAALDSELAVLRGLRGPTAGGVAEVLHEGVLDTSDSRARYAAFRQPIGLPAAELIGVLSALDERRTLLLRGIAWGVAQVMRAAHAQRLCLGPVSPGLIWGRCSQRVGRHSIAITLVALPAAGAAGRKQPPSVLELFPTGDADRLADQFGEPYRCSKRNDLHALGHLIRHLSDLARCHDDELLSLADALSRAEPSALDHPILTAPPVVETLY